MKACLFNLTKKKLCLSVIALWSCFFLSACGDSEKKSVSLHNQEQQFKNDTVVSGRVSHKNTPITAGEIKATDRSGKQVATGNLAKDGKYIINIPAMTKLPVVLSFYPNADSEIQQELKSVIIYASITRYEINDLTTFIAAKAKEMGGYTPANMTVAAENVVHVPDANKTSTGFRGDPTKQYGGWH